VLYWAKSLGKSHCDGRDMPTVAPTIARIATVGKVEAKSWQNPLNWTTSFYINGCGALRTVTLRRALFNPKKGSETISLGMNYCSMGLSQPPFRDTVPLTSINCCFESWKNHKSR
jgi:hypothetical protein